MQPTSQQPAFAGSRLRERGVVVGNYYDKYSSRNPIVRRLMRGFELALEDLVATTRAGTIHEVGCGEGRWTIDWARRGMTVRGSDFSAQVLEIARANGELAGVRVDFRASSIYDLEPPVDAAELIVCCEVLEHLEDPSRAVDTLARVASPWLIASVPREPIWSLLNMARGKYWLNLGNTPGHVQRWGSRRFLELLARRFEIVAVRRPLPWTMALCHVR